MYLGAIGLGPGAEQFQPDQSFGAFQLIYPANNRDHPVLAFPLLDADDIPCAGVAWEVGSPLKAVAAGTGVGQLYLEYRVALFGAELCVFLFKHLGEACLVHFHNVLYFLDCLRLLEGGFFPAEILLRVRLLPQIAPVLVLQEWVGGDSIHRWRHILVAVEQLLERSLPCQMKVRRAQAGTDPQRMRGAGAAEIPLAHGAQGLDQVIQHIGGELDVIVETDTLAALAFPQLLQVLDQCACVDNPALCAPRLFVERAVQGRLVTVQVDQEYS